jgi:hypothetical protein
MPGTYGYDFRNIFAEKFVEKIGVFCSKYSKFLQKCNHNNGFLEKRHFLPNFSKIAEKFWS